MGAARTVCVTGSGAAVFMAALTRLLPNREDGRASLRTDDFETERYAALARASLTETGTCPPLPFDADFTWSLFVNGAEVAVFRLTAKAAAGDAATVRFAAPPETEALAALNDTMLPTADIVARDSAGRGMPSAAFVDFVNRQLVPCLRDAATGSTNADLGAAVETVYAAVCELQPWQTCEVFLEKVRACTVAYRELLDRDPEKKLLRAVEQALVARVTDWARLEAENSSALLANTEAFAADIIGYDLAKIARIDRANRRRHGWTRLGTWLGIILLFMIPLFGFIVGLIKFYLNQSQP